MLRGLLIFILHIFSFIPSIYADASYEELLVDLKINYEDSEIISTILTNDSSLLVPLEDLQNLRIQENYLSNHELTVQNIKYINIKQLPDANYVLNRESLLLIIKLPSYAMDFQSLNSYQEFQEEGEMSQPISGAYVNYDATISNSGNIKTHNSKSRNQQTFGATNNFNYLTKENGSFSTGMFVRKSFNNKKDTRIVRLDTHWTLDNTDNRAQWRIGDNFTKNASWSSSTRFAGVQYSTNFKLSPGLVTHPLPEFVGSATVPTAIDVYTKSRSVYKANVQSGEFQIHDIPSSTGRGEFTVKTTDITGKTQSITMPYYIAPMLLKKGLSDFSFSLGMQRQNYSIESFTYRNIVNNADYMYGINDFWTSGAHFESMNTQKQLQSSIGITNKFKLHHYGVLSFSAGGNLHNNLSSAKKTEIDYSYNNSNFNFGTRISFYDKNFENTFIDKSRLKSTSDRNKKRTINSNLGFNVKNLGNFSLNYLFIKGGEDKIKMLSAGYSKQLTKRSAISFNTGTNLLDKKDNFITLSYNLSLDKHYISTEASKRNGKKSQRIDLYGHSDNSSNWSYNASFTNNTNNSSYSANTKKGTEYANLSFGASGTQKSYRQEVSASGGLALINNSFFATKPIQSNLVLVKVGENANVPVSLSHNLATTTNSKGLALIPNVAAYSTSTISIDAEKLPLDVNIEKTEAKVVTRQKSATLVDFNAKKQLSITATLVDDLGKELTEGHAVSIEGMDEVYSGYNGQLYLNDIAELRALNGTACKNDKCCDFNVDIIKNEEESVIDLGTVTCKIK